MLAGDHVPMKTAPAFCTSPSSASPSSSGTMSCRCSGAIALATASACAGPSTRQAMPAVASVDSRSARRLDAATMRSTSADPLGERRVPGHQPGQPVGPVLGLHDEVDGGEGRGRARTGHDHDLGGPGEGGGDADDARHLALGLGHVRVARAGDDVDRGHAARPVGHGGDRLGPADPVDLVHPGDGGGAQRGGVDPAVGGRGHAQGDARRRPPPGPAPRT